MRQIYLALILIISSSGYAVNFDSPVKDDLKKKIKTNRRAIYPAGFNFQIFGPAGGGSVFRENTIKLNALHWCF